MVSAYEMFAACVDLVVGTIKWVTWPFVVVSWPFRKAIQFIFSWWSYLIKTLVYSVLDTVLWPFQVVAAARREKETRNQLLIAQHQLFQATAVAKDLTMKYEIALEERTHARDALETCVEEKKRLKNRFQQAQAMLRKMDAERRHAWEMAEAQAKGGAEDDTIEGEPTSKEHIALDNVNTDRHPPPSPQVRPSVRMSDVSEHQQLFLNAELANGKSEISNHDLEDMLSPNQRSKRARRESNEGPLRSPDNSDRRESLGAAARRESLETESRRDSFGTGRRRDSNASAGTHLTLDEEADDGEDGSSGLVSTVVSCGLVGWTLVVLGASTAAIVCLFVIMILPSLIGPGKDSTTRRISEYVGCAKWFVLGFVFCFYMETEEFSWFKQGLEAIPDRDTLMAITQPASGRK